MYIVPNKSQKMFLFIIIFIRACSEVKGFITEIITD